MDIRYVSFKNIKTVNNNNSSRFGKYMEILFDLGGDPVGGRVTNYLLEKSRVVGPSQGERNFHSFYQICNGADAATRQNFYLERPDYFYYLSCSNCYQVQGIDDVADYQELMQAFQTVGITSEEIGEVFRVLAAVLWLGNISFSEDHSEKSSVQDRRVLEVVATLLQVNPQALEAALITRQIQSGSGARAEKYSKPNKATEADFTRDTLAKSLYSRLFDYLVRRINESIRKENFQGIQIGVLDIYGFEIFKYNSFEQLCM